MRVHSANIIIIFGIYAALRVNKYNKLNSFFGKFLKEKLENITIPKGHVLINLDVISLYLNVGEQLVIESIRK